jgi:hypothetical protein
MNEELWRTADDPFVLLGHLFPMTGVDSARPQDRESRLYLLACARRAWDRLPWACRALVEIAERLIDRWKAEREFRRVAYGLAEGLVNQRVTDPEGHAEVIAGLEEGLARLTGFRPPGAPPDPEWDPKTWPGLAYLVYAPYARATPAYNQIPADLHSADLIHEVFGDRPRPAHTDPSWLSTDVVALADRVYESQDFTLLPILADALQDAGCEDDHILAHCRDPRRVHVRGCWVVDAVRSQRRLPDVGPHPRA